MAAAAAVAGKVRPRPVEEWPLDARMLAAAAPVSYAETRASIRSEQALLGGSASLRDLAESAIPGLRSLHEAAADIWARDVRRMMNAAGPATTREAEASRRMMVEATVNLRAAERAVLEWRRAAAETTWTLRTALPAPMLNIVRSFLGCRTD